MTLRKSPPAPNLLCEVQARGYLSTYSIKQPIAQPSVLLQTYEKYKAKFHYPQKHKQSGATYGAGENSTLKTTFPPHRHTLTFATIQAVFDSPPRLTLLYAPVAAIEDAERIKSDGVTTPLFKAPLIDTHSTKFAELAHVTSDKYDKATDDLVDMIERTYQGSVAIGCEPEFVKATGHDPKPAARVDSPRKISPRSADSDEDEVQIDDSAPSDTGPNNSASTTRTSASEDDDELTRGDWEPLKALPHWNFHKILSQHVGGSAYCPEAAYEYVGEDQGGYNYVRMYTVTNGPGVGTYVIKILSVGTAARWLEQDAYMLRSEFGTIKLIKERTNCPVPEVIAYDDTLTNDLGAPYILMKACTGVPAGDIWYDRDEDGDWDEENADSPSPWRSALRMNFLRSLARSMAELQALDFDKIGTLDFDNIDANGEPTVGPVWHAYLTPDTTAEDMETEKILKEQPVFNSSLEHFIVQLRKKWPYSTLDSGRVQVMHNMMDALFRSHPFSKSMHPSDRDGETFVLRHDDLNFQNIFCDPATGEVTGIIDWECTSTAPRCIGYASLPIFLTLDWFPDYALFDGPHTPWNLDIYRQVYADEMIKATGVHGDGKYTYKSAMYQAAYAALYGSSSGGDIGDFVRKMLRQDPSLVGCVDIEVFLTWLGDNWQTHGEYVKKAIAKVAEPMVPNVDFEVSS